MALLLPETDKLCSRFFRSNNSFKKVLFASGISLEPSLSTRVPGRGNPTPLLLQCSRREGVQGKRPKTQRWDFGRQQKKEKGVPRFTRKVGVVWEFICNPQIFVKHKVTKIKLDTITANQLSAFGSARQRSGVVEWMLEQGTLPTETQALRLHL